SQSRCSILTFLGANGNPIPRRPWTTSREGPDGLDHAIELLARAVLQRRFPQPARPVGGILTPLDQLDCGQRLVELRQAAAVGIRIAFDQAAALQDLDTQLVVGPNSLRCGLEPFVPMGRFNGVTQWGAAHAAKSADHIERGEQGQLVSSHPTPLVDAMIEPSEK